MAAKKQTVMHKILQEFRAWEYRWKKYSDGTRMTIPEKVDVFIEELSQKYKVTEK